MTDMVNHPPHYKSGGIEAINVIEAFGLGYRLGNVVKYVLRAGAKGKRLEDLQKAAWYLAREIGASDTSAPNASDELTQLRAYIKLLEADRDNVVRVNVEMAARLDAFMDAPTPGSACKQQTSAPLVRCQEVV